MWGKLSLAGLVSYGVMLADVVAQPKWLGFPPEQSRLVLDAPDLPRMPVRAQELTGASPTVRTFQYLWGHPARPAAYADITIQQPTSGASFDRSPDYVALIPAVWPAVKASAPVFGTEERSVAAPLGEIKYRTLSIGPRQCLGFGGAFGAVLQGDAQMAGVKLVGGNWIYGMYCPPSGQTLTPEGARYVLEGIGWTDTKTAVAGRSKPATITTAH